MRNQSRSHGSSGCRAPTAAQRHFRPWVEPLEDRRLLALFIENFSDDYDPAQPGFDTWDSDPNTVFPDDMAIPHLLFGGAAISSTNLFPPAPSAPHYLALTRSSASYVIDFRATQGQPGGLDPEGEVVAVAVDYLGLGRLDFFGANGVKSVTATAGFSVWSSVTVTGNSPSNSGAELGAIQWVQITAVEGLFVDDVAVLVLDEGFSNNPPVANDDLLATLPGQPVEFDPLANDGDFDGDPLTLTAINFNPPNGTLTSHNGVFTYTPVAGFHGVETITYTINDGRGGSVEGLVRVTVNTPPPAPLQTIPLPHLHTGPFTFSVSDLWDGVADADGDSLRLVGFDTPNFGTLADNDDGTLTYFPSEPDGLVRSDVQFQFRLSDGFVVGEKGAAFLRPNETPISFDSDLRGLLGHLDLFRPVVGGVGYDPDGDDIVPVLDRAPTAGTVRFEGGGSEPWTFVYESKPGNYPHPGGYIEDSFTFHLLETANYRSFGNAATVRMAWPNSPPIPVDDEVGFSVQGGEFPPLGEFRIDISKLLLNDFDVDGDQVFAERIVRQPQYGTARFDFADETLVYQSHNFFDGVDSLTYRVTDLRGESQEATVFLHRSLLPLLRDDHYTAIRSPIGGPPRGIAFPAEFGLFANDLDAEGRPARLDGVSSYVTLYDSAGMPHTLDEVTDVVTISKNNGEIFVHGDGSFSFIPAPGYAGGFTLNYEWDWIFPTETSDTAEAVIEVLNLTPVAEAGGPYTIFEGQSIVLDATASYDPNGDPLEFEWDLGFLNWYGANPTVHWSEIKGEAHFDEQEDVTIGLLVRDGKNSKFDRATLRIRGDGLRDDEEERAPNNGDGNNDGIPDNEQGNVASLVFPSSSYSATIVSPETTYLVGVDSRPNLPPMTLPGTPFFYLDFTVAGLTPGQATIVSLTRPSPMAINSYAKYGPRPDDPSTPNDESVPQWYEFLYDGSTGARFYDANGQEIPPHGSTPVARIDLHLIDGGRGDSDLTANGQIEDPGAPVFVELSPRVASVIINDGHAQRSKINSLTVTFDGLVTVDPGAFELRRHGTKKPMDTKFTLSEIDGRTVALLTFKGAWVQYGTLKDGNYTLTIRAAKIRDATGDLLDGDGDGIAGGNYVDEFFRRFGDTDGDGDVDSADKGVFLSAFGKRARNPGYLWYLDFNANGRIGAEDLAHFILTKVRHNHRP